MRQFGEKRPSDDIIKRAKATGWDVDQSELRAGGDGLWIRDFQTRSLQVYYNVVNGHFYVYTSVRGNKAVATHADELDHLPWYAELLELFNKSVNKYVIVTTRHRDLYYGGEVYLFWGRNEKGYTAVMQTAGLYDAKEAAGIIKGTMGDIAIPISTFDLDETFFDERQQVRDIDILRLLNKNKANKALIDEWRIKNGEWEKDEPNKPHAPAYRIERRDHHAHEV